MQTKQIYSKIQHAQGFLSFFLISVFLQVKQVASFESGSPWHVCAYMFPKHDGIYSRSSPCPFNITLSKNTYSPGDNITVRLVAPEGRSFEGFQIKAVRLQGDIEEAVGSFSTDDPGTTLQMWYPQEDSFKNCVTHNDKNDKREVKLMWQAPIESLGDIRFLCTFVETFTVFWDNVESSVVNASVLPPANRQQTFDGKFEDGFTPITLEDCGKTQGCLLYPRFCSGDGCNYVVTWKMDPTKQYITFAIKAKAVGYLSLGISRDDIMDDDETISCVQRGDLAMVQYGHNSAEGKYNDRHRVTTLRGIQTKKEDGYIYCRATKPVFDVLKKFSPKGVTNFTFDLLGSNWYLFLAWGNVYPGKYNGALKQHAEAPIISGPVDFSSNNIHRDGFTLPIMIQLHAAFMLLAWGLFGSVAVVISRYYRHGPLLLENWFKFHMAAAILCGFFTAMAFILVFSHLQTWTENAPIHAYMGCFVTSLMLLQLLFGLMRPGLEDEFRPIFNWLHSAFGQVTHILAAVTILFGIAVKTLYAQLQMWLFITVGIGIGLQFLFWRLLVFESIVNSKNKEPKDNINEESKSNKDWAKLLIILYVVTTTLINAVAVVFIFIF